ncbi:hypothetical protein RYH73_09010 [Olivibacter sp. CPCC 100613]|uniref:hypothetical protein n=1 Tax=Olivibacter sp. CPCC 100613 TaxID=3079931 RepID=UPI002FFD3276
MEPIITISQLTLLLLSIGLFVSTLEYLKKVEIFSVTGLSTWNVMQLRWYKNNNHFFNHLLSNIFTVRGISLLFIVRLIALAGLFLFPFASPASWLLLGILLSNLLLSSMITFYGSDGSDQMNLLIIVTLFLCTCPFMGSLNLTEKGLWFIGLQSCLSYCVAGIAKLLSHEWRNASAVRDVFSTKTYGSAWAAKLLNKHPVLNFFLCWNVIIMECLFPLCLILPWPVASLFLIWGAIFHLLTTIIMGLNSFFWAFLATYPAIYYINHQMPWHLF